MSTDWRHRAVCREEDPELFFPVGSSSHAQYQTEQAKAVCLRCPVIEHCLQWALETRQDSGVWGGLSEQQRRRIHRRAAPGAQHEETAAPEPKTPRTLQTIFAESTTPLFGGHLGWTGPDKIYLGGRAYSPRRLAFIVGRGRAPEGAALLDCGSRDCVLPAHLTDRTERGRCGTRPGYQLHRSNGEEPCAPCRQANTDADNRLRRTGTTKTSQAAA